MNYNSFKPDFNIIPSLNNSTKVFNFPSVNNSTTVFDISSVNNWSNLFEIFRKYIYLVLLNKIEKNSLHNY